MLMGRGGQSRRGKSLIIDVAVLTIYGNVETWKQLELRVGLEDDVALSSRSGSGIAYGYGPAAFFTGGESSKRGIA